MEKENLTETQIRQQNLAGINEQTRPLKKEMTIRLPEILHRNFKVRAAFEGRSMLSILESLIEKYVESRGGL